MLPQKKEEEALSYCLLEPDLEALLFALENVLTDMWLACT